jgi:hypothetical protein
MNIAFTNRIPVSACGLTGLLRVMDYFPYGSENFLFRFPLYFNKTSFVCPQGSLNAVSMIHEALNVLIHFLYAASLKVSARLRRISRLGLRSLGL